MLEIVAEASAEQLSDACGDPAGTVCEWILDATGSTTLAEIGDWAVGKPLRILLIVLGAIIVARLARRALESAVRRMADRSLQERLRSAVPVPTLRAGAAETADRTNQRIDVICSVVRGSTTFVVYLIAVFMILSELGVDLGPLIAGAGVAGIAIGFGAQSLVKDFFSGLFILLEDQYAVGDTVDVGEATGVVESVTLRLTRLRSVDGVVWHVPNGQILRVGNMSQHWSRALLDVEVAYDTDLEQAKRVIGDVAGAYAKGEPAVLGEPEVWGVEALGPSAVVIRLVIKTLPSEQWRVSRALRERIKRGLDEAGIEIPFPQQTVWMRQEGAPPSATDDRG